MVRQCLLRAQLGGGTAVPPDIVPYFINIWLDIWQMLLNNNVNKYRKLLLLTNKRITHLPIVYICTLFYKYMTVLWQMLLNNNGNKYRKLLLLTNKRITHFTYSIYIFNGPRNCNIYYISSSLWTLTTSTENIS
jgi:hypothetical protein